MNSESVLRIYRAQSGQWAGQLIVDGLSVAGVAGCQSADEVEDLAIDSGLDFDSVEVEQ